MATRTNAIRRSRHCAASLAYSARLASRLRPRGWVAASLIRRRASAVALSSSSESSRPRLYSAGISGLDRTMRSSGAPATTRPNLNSSSSRSSRWRPRSAAATMASTASCSAASDRSAGLDQCPAARVTTKSRVASPTFPPSSSLTRPVLASAGRLPSATARRRAGSASSSATTAKSSSPRVRAAAADVTTAESCCLASASEARLGPLMAVPGAAQPRAARACTRGDRSAQSSGRPRAGFFLLAFEILQEPLHAAALPGLVLQRLTHDPAGEFHRQGAHLGPERVDRPPAVGLDLRLRRVHPALVFSTCLLAHLGDDPGALLPGLLTEPGRLVPGLGELLLVLLKQPVRLGLRLLGALDAALDFVGALLERLLDPRQQHLGQRAEDDEERDRADDQLGQVGDERVLRSALRQMQHARLPLGPRSQVMKNGTAMPISASASVSAKPIHIYVVIMPAASGWRAIASMAWPKTRPMPMPGPMAARP